MGLESVRDSAARSCSRRSSSACCGASGRHFARRARRTTQAAFQNIFQHTLLPLDGSQRVREILAPRDSRLTWRRAQVLATATLAIRSPSYKPHKREERKSSARERRAPAGLRIQCRFRRGSPARWPGVDAGRRVVSIYHHGRFNFLSSEPHGIVVTRGTKSGSQIGRAHV